MRFVAHLVVLMLILSCAARSLLWAGPSPDELAHGIRETIGDAVAAGATHTFTTSSLGANLADYANNIGRDPARYEPLVEAARRILAGDRTPKQPPDATSHTLAKSATALLAALASTPAPPPADAAELRLTAHLARFHAQRIIAAVHYNLFKRGLRLAELLAATAREKEAVASWREAVAVATAGKLASAPALRAELKQLELNLKELEEQCCPPDEAILKEKVWQPSGNP